MHWTDDSLLVWRQCHGCSDFNDLDAEIQAQQQKLQQLNQQKASQRDQELVNRLSDLENKLDHKKSRLDIEGLFIAIGQTPDNKAFADFVALDEKGYIVAGEDCRTATKGIFAAGDCRTKSVRQLTTAAADGAVAALAAVAYCG